MKYLPFYADLTGRNNDDEVFAYLCSTMRHKICSWDYFVNWTKAFAGFKQHEDELNLLNSLVGSGNPKEELRRLIKKYPSIYRILPGLIAIREMKFDLLASYNWDGFTYLNYDFSVKEPSEEQLSDAVEFAERSGFLKRIADKHIRSIPDYFFGVEVGLDSNGRKNRGGTAMESIISFFVSSLCKRNGYTFIHSANPKNIEQKWGITVGSNEALKIVDFAVKTPRRLHLIETNFYSGGGSKLKATAGEYIETQNFWTQQGHNFIWITDGKGWASTSRNLRDTFNHNDHTINLQMILDGILEEILKHEDR